MGEEIAAENGGISDLKVRDLYLGLGHTE